MHQDIRFKRIVKIKYNGKVERRNMVSWFMYLLRLFLVNVEYY